MKRTKLRDRSLPHYSHGEERFNTISHIVGGGFGVIALVACLWRATLNDNVWGIVGGAIYGGSMILLYTVSSVYHGLRHTMGKKVMQIIDHCTIYLLIGGTYTPILFCSIRPVSPGWAWTLFGIVWGLAIMAATLTAIDLKRRPSPVGITTLSSPLIPPYKRFPYPDSCGCWRAVSPIPWALSYMGSAKSTDTCTPFFTYLWWLVASCNSSAFCSMFSDISFTPSCPARRGIFLKKVVVVYWQSQSIMI